MPTLNTRSHELGVVPAALLADREDIQITKLDIHRVSGPQHMSDHSLKVLEQVNHVTLETLML